ncbi:MAG: type II toxin-antitoxin system RelE/ParE family toxin [Acidobacteria bacterium]|nr:type II toxin-antitoxin system RelE/ParE family toxin [Acidobacteriota bacterium]
MAQVIWTGPACRDVQEIAEYISLDSPEAAKDVVSRIERHVSRLKTFPNIGSFVPENPEASVRQLVEPPCRIFYRVERGKVHILHVLRFERLLRLSRLDNDG